jgi:hypothetical protein
VKEIAEGLSDRYRIERELGAEREEPRFKALMKRLNFEK